MATLTLVEARKAMVNQGQTERAGIIQQFAERSDLLRAIPFMDIAGNSYAYSREGALSTAAFRGVNEDYTASTGVVDPAVEALRIVGGDLDVDNFILDTGGEV